MAAAKKVTKKVLDKVCRGGGKLCISMSCMLIKYKYFNRSEKCLNYEMRY